jgi:hypothetical protein
MHDQVGLTMSKWVQTILVAAAACLWLPAQAESLRCPGGIAAEGDSKLSVVYKCGQPLLRDSFCAGVVYNQSLQPVPEPIASVFVPCQPTDEWLYERGPGNLIATVRFRSGVAQSITYGRVPR